MVKLNPLMYPAALLLAATVGVSTVGATSAAAGPSALDYRNPGSFTFKVPKGVTSISAELYGAQGGDGQDKDGNPSPGGKGGSTKATLRVTPEETLQINVGGKGGNGPGSGGENGGSGSTSWGGGGGGASDIRIGNHTLNDREMVAGGGGGGGSYGYIVGGISNNSGGAGGGKDGTRGAPTEGSDSDRAGLAGTESGGGPGGQTRDRRHYGSPGKFGKGGYADIYAGGGGGGWWGGGGGAYFGGGGGGSGHVSENASDSSFGSGVQPGDGRIIIRFNTSPG